ncbi:MAG: bifunctional demethylmenaquinone methyltransferase/2-methoxy-6-polyprenyl-1,4-benzoquinol methylase UbiE [Bacteroidales bacterium]|jgi:demethylmenaquinone methyltransferase/2-methoxy-6-polyprenyl-1,4-benzoquinol methylase|nr:bifunctional demethylmenaquinone methyltransferase/2-methoxy-6-polyprenyl-1,4-benzoquinol methylase UbiE [Bacteroidales bacterium]
MVYRVEKIAPHANSGVPKGVQIERMFDEIAGRYDLLNHALSLGIDRYWRRKGVMALKDLAPQRILDVATGTGDLAMEACRLLHPEKVLAVDLSEKMMRIGREKAARAGLSGTIDFQRQDGAALQLATASFDAAVMAFGIRNFEDMDAGLREIYRTLRPGGKLMILELSTPEHFPLKQAYLIYSRIIPLVGQCIARNRAAYRYLPKSVGAFPQNGKMADILRKNGFSEVSYQKLSAGICTLYLGKKVEENN